MIISVFLKRTYKNSSCKFRYEFASVEEFPKTNTIGIGILLHTLNH